MIAGFTLAAAGEGFGSSAVSVALQNMAGSFGASPDEISWVVTLYLAAYTIVLPLSAWLSDVLGQRLYIGASILLYMLASVGCATSHSLGSLLAFRVLQGAAGAPFVARAMFSFGAALTPNARRVASYLFLASFGIRVCAAPLAGYLADNESWRWIFLVPIPIMGLGGLLPLMLSKEIWPRRRHPIPDLFGMALLIAGLGGLYIVLYRGQREGWVDSHRIVELAIAAAIGLPLFLWHQRSHGTRRRVLSLASLRHRGVAVGVFLGLFMGVMVYGGVYLVPQYLRLIGKHDAFSAGKLTAVDSFGSLIGLLTCSYLLNLTRTRTWLVISGLLFTASMALFATRMTSYTPDEALYLPLILRGLSIGFLLPTAASFTFQAVSSVSHVHTAEARGLYYMSRQIGGAIGVAVIAAMLDLRETLHSTQLAEHLAPTNPTVSRALTALGTGPVRHGINPVGVTRAGQVLLSRLVTREANVLAFQDVFICLAVIGVIVCGLSMLYPRMRPGRLRNPTPQQKERSGERLSASWATSIATSTN